MTRRFPGFGDFDILDQFMLDDHFPFWNNFQSVIPPWKRLDSNPICQASSRNAATESHNLAQGSIEDGGSVHENWEQRKQDEWNREYRERRTAFEENERKLREQHQSEVKAEQDRIQKRQEYYRQQRIEKERQQEELDRINSLPKDSIQSEEIKQTKPKEKPAQAHGNAKESTTNTKPRQSGEKSKSQNEEKYHSKPEVPNVEEEKFDTIQGYNDNEKNILATMKIPGHTSRDLRITTVDGKVEIKGFKQDITKNGRLSQTFHKVFTLPDNISERSIHATVDTRGNLELAGTISNQPRDDSYEPLIETVEEEQWFFEESYTGSGDHHMSSDVNDTQHEQTVTAYADDDITIEVVE